MTPQQLTAARKMRSQGFLATVIAKRFDVSTGELRRLLATEKPRESALVVAAREALAAARNEEERACAWGNYADVLGKDLA